MGFLGFTQKALWSLATKELFAMGLFFEKTK
jgi:hypothetical protein